MFSRVILRRIDPAAEASSRADDIENEPLSPRGNEPSTTPEMTERGTARRSRLGIRRPTVPSRFRFSSSTEATSSAASDWNGTQASNAGPQSTQPTSNGHSHDEDDDDDDIDLRRQSTLPSRYSVVVDLPSTRLHLPGLQRTWTQGSNGPPTSRPSEAMLQQSRGPPSPACRPRTPPSPACRPHTPPAAIPTEPVPAYVPYSAAVTRLGSNEADQLYPGGDRRSRGFFTAPDPAEAQLAAMAEDGRRRRQRSSRGSQRSSRREGETPEQRTARHERRRRRQRLRDIEDPDAEPSQRPHPKHFLFCFPWIKSRKVRSQILQCFVSGLFLVLLLTVYLALSATKNITNSEFSVLLILIILFATIFFCQGLIRLCFKVFRPKSAEDHRRTHLPQMYGPGGYAVPRQPIRVVLARDEEAAGIESEATKVNPPAYGLWRESVRVDPNRIYWQRNTDVPETTPEEDEEEGEGEGGSEGDSSSSSGGEEAHGSSPSSSRVGRRAAPRPPSYASEDGVSYIIEAQPRSTAPSSLGTQIVPMPMPMTLVPTTPSPLPVHPSEVGRIGRPPSR